MLKSTCTLLLSTLLISSISKAQTPNYSEHVAPILFKNCLTCHRTNGVAGSVLNLETYKKTFFAKNGIAKSTRERIMPPWPPDPNYKRMAHERVLSDAELKTIQDWVNIGAPEGDSTLKPKLPTFSDNGEMVSPDVTLNLPAYAVPENIDHYRCFVMPSGAATQKFISEYEFIPGNRGIVHHVLIFYDTSGECKALDNADPKTGYEGFGGVGSSKAQLIAAWVPGSGMIKYPSGFGFRLPKNADIVFQFHFAPNSLAQKDSSIFKMKYHTVLPVRSLGLAPALNHTTSLTNGPLFIQANTVKTFNSTYTVPANITLLSLAPHMHLIGKSIKVFAVGPTKDTIRLIDIPRWDFHWQGSFDFKKLIKIPVLYKLQAIATYDNTPNNPFNPSDPPKNVALGEHTTDEMMLVYFSYTTYVNGDENIVADTTTPKRVGFSPFLKEVVAQGILYPNPLQGNILNWKSNSKVEKVVIMDYNGKVLQEIKTLPSQTKAVINTLPKGIYLVKLKTNAGFINQKLVIGGN